jgi:hypothetical protein
MRACRRRLPLYACAGFGVRYRPVAVPSWCHRERAVLLSCPNAPCLVRRHAGGWLLALAAISPALAAAPVEHVLGKAYASDGRLLYSESHWLFDDPAGPSRVVLYRCPDGQPFARKVVSRQGPAQAPDFELVEQPLGYREGVRSGADGRQVFVQRGAQAEELSAPLATTPPLVVDAGFDAYIQTHWNVLSENATSVPFLLPSRLRTYDVRIKRIADLSIDGRAAREYRISLASWLGFVLPHVDASYDNTSRQLLRLSGLGNIRGANGHNLDVRVDFAPADRDPAQLAEGRAALTETLDGRCDL